MAAGLATLAELTPDRFDALEALTGTLKEVETLFAAVGLTACITQAGSLFNIHLTEGPVLDYAGVMPPTTRSCELSISPCSAAGFCSPRAAWAVSRRR